MLFFTRLVHLVCRAMFKQMLFDIPRMYYTTTDHIKYDTVCSCDAYMFQDVTLFDNL